MFNCQYECCISGLYYNLVNYSESMNTKDLKESIRIDRADSAVFSLQNRKADWSGSYFYRKNYMGSPYDNCVILPIFVVLPVTCSPIIFASSFTHCPSAN